MKKIYLTILILLVFSCDTSKISFEVKNGGGSINSPSQSLSLITISSKDDLALMRNNLNGSFELASDINLADVDWIPIGNKNSPFTGTLNGKGFTISNLSISSENHEHLGFFGVLGKGSIVHNLKLSNIAINNLKQTNTCNFKGVYYDEKEVTAKEIHCSAGGLVGFSQGIIDSVEINGNSLIEGYVNVGGLVGIVGEGYLRKLLQPPVLKKFLRPTEETLEVLLGIFAEWGPM